MHGETVKFTLNNDYWQGAWTSEMVRIWLGNDKAMPLLGSEHQSCSPYPFMLLTELSELTFPTPAVHKSHMQPGSRRN